MKKSLSMLIVFALSIAFAQGSAFSQEEDLKLIMGEPKTISVSNPKRIAIGNPQVVDIVNVSKDEMTLMPKAPGSTTLVFWDNFGEQSFKVRVYIDDVVDLKRRIDNLLSRIKVTSVYSQAEEEEGRVLLLGNVKEPQERERIYTLLGPLKEKVVDLINIKEEESAVEIDVQILELDKDATSTLGFTWPGSLNIIETGSTGISSAGTPWGKLFKILNVQRGTASATTPWTLKLDMLIQEGKARILSRPRLSCQSGKEAEMLVGGEKPVFTTQVATAGGQGTSVEYKEFGIKLKIKPVISEGERIKLSLNVEVSDVGEAETIGSTNSPTAKAYPLTKRTASTELFIDDGETLAIGGLIKQKTEEDLRKFPWLADVPVLGLFFRQKVTKIGSGQGSRGDTELFITLTPTIIGRKLKAEKTQAPAKSLTNISNAGSQSSQDNPDPLAKYTQIIQVRLTDNLSYPQSAKKAGFQGEVKLGMHLLYDGKLLDVAIKSSSGYKTLDDNAINIAQKISPYPPFPPEIKEKDIWVEIPIVYKVD